MTLPVHNVTLSKFVNNKHQILYPKTLSTLVKHGNTTISDKITSIENDITDIKNVVPESKESEHLYALTDNDNNELFTIDDDGTVNMAGDIVSPTIDALWEAIRELQSYHTA